MSDNQRPGYGQEPKASPAARWVSVILGLGLIALAGVAGRELWAHYAQEEQQSWVLPLLDSLSQGTFQDWMIPASIVAVIVGLFLVLVALKPRRRDYLPLESQVSLWARPVDLARNTTATAKRVPGITAASTQVRRGTVRLHATATTGDSTVEQRVHDDVHRNLDPLVGDSMTVKLSIDDSTGGEQK
ncbi:MULTISPECIES: DUF6286 domain-containing protein [unclassified Corynebacterium]|uniref:DUF6286 domain-containing protein n=1 Tax=unclassified Corynebacterium TaxID=2624378 RepID=UPI0029CA951F|nr:MULTISPECIES: DUF6286 domain-containing protein [unclassified Corynebacterium]WPF66469.1 DUF6286 domain-containing protein [Corynebacterium sp. 22KM0430]WPF68959.1 DUF6286 domain-containing protein [Corynebacterium sp. 21KM1197]